MDYVQKIKTLEQNRIFCKHDMVHFLDVCRLAEIEWLELCMNRMAEGKISCKKSLRMETVSKFLVVNKELIYAAGLLHDIGRWMEYENKIRHEIASGELALEILKDCGFTEGESTEVILAIKNHRNREIKDEISSLTRNTGNALTTTVELPKSSTSKP